MKETEGDRTDEELVDLEDDYALRYRYTMNAEVVRPLKPDSHDWFRLDRLVLTVKQDDELGKWNWSGTYDLLPLWPDIRTRIDDAFDETDRRRPVDWAHSGSHPPCNEPHHVSVREEPGDPRMIVEVSLPFVVSDGLFCESGFEDVRLRVTIDKRSGALVDMAVVGVPPDDLFC